MAPKLQLTNSQLATGFQSFATEELIRERCAFDFDIGLNFVIRDVENSVFDFECGGISATDYPFADAFHVSLYGIDLNGDLLFSIDIPFGSSRYGKWFKKNFLRGSADASGVSPWNKVCFRINMQYYMHVIKSFPEWIYRKFEPEYIDFYSDIADKIKKIRQQEEYEAMVNNPKINIQDTW